MKRDFQKKKMGDTDKQIQQIREENRRILQRLEDVLGGGVNTCSDCRGHINQSELENLDQRIADLEERDRKRQDEVVIVKREIEQFQKELYDFLNSTNAPKRAGEIHKVDQPGKQNSRKLVAAAGSSHGTLCPETNQQNDPTIKQSYTNNASEVDLKKAQHKHMSSDQASSDRAGKDGVASTHKTKTENEGQNFKNKESSASRTKSSKHADTVKSGSKDVEVNKSSEQNLKVDGRKILKPNFLGKTDLKESNNKCEARNYSKPPVKKEEYKRYTRHGEWWAICKAEEDAGSQSEVQFLDGVHTVLCIDISESMVDCWTQVQTFVFDYLDGLEKLVKEENFNEENVALVTFGHDTNVHVRLTKDLPRVRKAFEEITLGGPSPLFGGILMAVCVAQSNDRNCIIKGLEIHKRIVLISDGHFTETELSHGPDLVVTSACKQDESMAHLVDIIERFPSSGKELICVPVGEANQLLHEQLEQISCGKRFSYTDGTKLARRFYLTSKSIGRLPGQRELGSLSDMLSLGAISLPGTDVQIGELRVTADLSHLTTEDRENVQEIMEDHKKLTLESLKRRVFSKGSDFMMYIESDSKDLPRIGSRVRRGPDWDWENQDSKGPGTVIGHDENGKQIWVDWDANGHTNVYHYGAGRYDVLLVDEPRIVGSDGNIKVGCVVQPGDGWKFDFRCVKQDEEGVVIRIHEHKVQVRWENGYRGDYTYSTTSSSELKIATKCSRHQSQNNNIQRRNKNKNARP